MTLDELNILMQDYRIQSITLDFYNSAYNIIPSKQLDNCRYILCTLTENGTPRNVKSNETPRIRLLKPDNTYVYNDCDRIEDGRVLVSLTEQILAVNGKAVADIQLTSSDGNIYSTQNFIININSTPYQKDAIESSNEFDALNNMIKHEEERAQIILELKNSVKSVKDSLNSEINRATNAENTLTTNLNSEISRAKSAESTLTTNLSDEVTRAKGAENTNANAISAETTRATAKENEIANNLSSHTSNTSNPHSVTKAQVGLGNVENKSSATIRGEITKSNVTTALGYTPLNQSLKGSASGLAELDANGKVPSSQLPSYVDDVIEGYFYNSKFYKESAHTTAITGETGKIYIDLSTNKTYRWSGSAFVVISETLALGETSSTAYRGDRGKIAYDHSQSTHARTDATKVEKSSTNGNIKINGTETTVYTHPSGTNPHGTTKSDVGLGNVGNFKAVSTVANQGLTDTEKSNARANIGAAASSEIEKKLDKDGDSKDLTNTFVSQDSTNVTQWTDVNVLTSGEKHSSVFNKISTMFKNIRYLYKMLGTADISTLGNGADIGTVTGALSKLNSDLGNFKKVLDDWTPSKTLQLYDYHSYLVIQSHPIESTYTYVGIVTGTGNLIADIYTTENKPTISVSNNVLTLSVPDAHYSHWIVYQL